MIISRTPFRISFFGGGTDYPVWYRKHGGRVLAAAINRYCYISCRYLPPFFEHRFRVVWSKTELCQTIDEITHPAVRGILEYVNFDRGLEIHHAGDLPARSGIGSSSSFTVGMLHALHALRGKIAGKEQLANESIDVEQNHLQELVGSQDQIMAAYGGVNHLKFHQNGNFDVVPVTVGRDRLDDLQSYLMLFDTKKRRTASDVAKSYVNDSEQTRRQLEVMQPMVDEALSILNGDGELTKFGELLHETWVAKRQLSPLVSNSVVDDLYERARSAGAIGGKLTGAGGGGFLLLFVPLDKRAQVRRALEELVYVPFSFDYSGSQIIFYDPQPSFEDDLEAR